MAAIFEASLVVRSPMQKIRFWVAGAVLSANIICIMLLWQAGQGNAFAAFCLVCASIISAFQFSAMIIAKDLRPLTFAFLLYWLYGFIFPGIFQVRSEKYFWPSSATGSDMAEKAAVIILLGTACFVLGAVFSASRRSFHGATNLNSRNAARHAALLSSVILIYCLFLLVWLGPAPYFLPRELADLALGRAIGRGTLLLPFVRTFPMALAIASLAIALSVFKSSTPQLSAHFALICAALANLIVNSPIAAPRYFLVAIAFVVSVIGFRHGFNRFRILAYTSAPMLLYFAFPFLGQWNRGQNMDGGINSMALSDYMSHGDLDGFQSVMNAVNLTEYYGFGFGNRMVSSAFFFVPRSLWIGKSEATGSEAAAAAGYSFLNISMPLPGELYADFGMLGVALGMLCLGFLLRTTEVRFARLGVEASTNMVIVAIFAGFMPIFLRGPLLSTIQALVVAAALVWLWGRLSRSRAH